MERSLQKIRKGSPVEKREGTGEKGVQRAQRRWLNRESKTGKRGGGLRLMGEKSALKKRKKRN